MENVENVPEPEISIHVPREGHDQAVDQYIVNKPISIHVPREGHDPVTCDCMPFSSVISIHVPREGHDDEFGEFISGVMQFQSTCPARGTTYPSKSFVQVSRISIHVPREGHDLPR